MNSYFQFLDFRQKFPIGIFLEVYVDLKDINHPSYRES